MTSGCSALPVRPCDAAAQRHKHAPWRVSASVCQRSPQPTRRCKHETHLRRCWLRGRARDCCGGVGAQLKPSGSPKLSASLLLVRLTSAPCPKDPRQRWDALARVVAPARSPQSVAALEHVSGPMTLNLVKSACRLLHSKCCRLLRSHHPPDAGEHTRSNDKRTEATRHDQQLLQLYHEGPISGSTPLLYEEYTQHQLDPELQTGHAPKGVA